jgi:hypothetical protein
VDEYVGEHNQARSAHLAVTASIEGLNYETREEVKKRRCKRIIENAGGIPSALRICTMSWRG